MDFQLFIDFDHRTLNGTVVHSMQATRSAPSCQKGCFFTKTYDKIVGFFKKLLLNEKGPPAFAEFEFNKEFEIEAV